MKKFISLFLVVSILALSIPLTAKERKGADLIVKKTDGQQVRGELIAGKENSLLLLERESGADVTVDVGDIRVITIVKKSQIMKGAGWGLLIGGGSGALIALTGQPFDDESIINIGLLAVFLGGLGLLIGFFSNLGSGKIKTIQIEGKSDSEIQEILEKLRKKAKVRNSQ